MKARRRVGVAWRLAVMALAFVSAGADEPRADEPRTAESANKEDGGSDERALLERFRREFVEITPGRGAFAATFEMGRREGQPAEQPPHRVTVQRPFAIARYEVPQNLWQAVMGSNPSRWKGARNAVEMLSYDEAVDFCQKATERLRAARLIGDNQVVRLPSEAEWEYAARAGTKGVYSFGDDAAALSDYAWSTHNAAGNDPPVGAKKPNAWGLYDAHGYLWEWCADAWHDDYTGIRPTARPGWPAATPSVACSAAAVGKIPPNGSPAAIAAPPLAACATTPWACAPC